MITIWATTHQFVNAGESVGLRPPIPCIEVMLKARITNVGNIRYGLEPNSRPPQGWSWAETPLSPGPVITLAPGEHQNVPIRNLGHIWAVADIANDILEIAVFGSS